MNYYKRINTNRETTTVESYSHDLPIPGATHIDQTEFDAYIASLPPPINLDYQTRQQAKARAIQAIHNSAGNTPWDKILNDIIIALGWE